MNSTVDNLTITNRLVVDGQLLIRSGGEIQVAQGADIECEQEYWDDLRFPSSALNPAGSPTAMSSDVNNGWLTAGATGTAVIFCIAQLPHCWLEGSTLYPHVHWHKTTSAAGNVVWEFAYRWAARGGVMDGAFTATTASTVADATPDDNTALRHLVTKFGPLSADGKKLSDILICRISRLGSDAGDTYGATCALLEFDIHYQIDRLGSRTELVK